MADQPPTEPMPAATGKPAQPGLWGRFRVQPTPLQVGAWVLAGLAVLIVIAALAGDLEEDDEVAIVDDTTTTTEAEEETTEEVDEATTTAAPTTTTTAAPATTTTQPRPPPPPPTEPVEVLRVSGTDNTETEDFTVEGPWELHWEIPPGGAGLIITAKDAATDQTVHRVSPDPGTGSARVRSGCTCYLEIQEFGSTYTVWVVDRV